MDDDETCEKSISQAFFDCKADIFLKWDRNVNHCSFSRLADKYQIIPNAVAVAWILRHPAGIQAIVETTNAERLRGICRASGIRLTREEWYELYLSAGNQLP